jgi:S-formylglutathione hydrolase FrmB
MNINLLSQNLLLGLCFIIAALLFFLVTKRLNTLKLKRKWGSKQLLWWVGLSVTASLALELILLVAFRGQKLPLFFVIFLPTCLSVSFLIMTVRQSSNLDRLTAAISVVLSISFGLLLTNNYFQYYPTLYTLLGINNYRHVSVANQTAVTFRYDATLTKPSNKDTLESANTDIDQSLPAKGQIFSMKIPGTISNFKARTSYIYVPPIAFSTLKLNLPVIVLLPGSPGQTTDWLYGGRVEATMDNFASRHNGVSPIVVMTDDQGTLLNDTECVDSPRGNVETYLTQDVPNFIKSHFDVSANPADWAIGGLSDGGMCGIMLTLTHPSVYHYFLDFGGEIGPEVGSKSQTVNALFKGSETAWENHQPAYLLQTKKYSGLGGFFAVGKSDSYIVTTAIKQLYAESVQDKFAVVSETINGQHSFGVWQQSFQDALPWLSNKLGATACYTSCY